MPRSLFVLSLILLPGCAALLLPNTTPQQRYHPFNGYSGYAGFTRSDSELDVTYTGSLTDNPAELRQKALVFGAQAAERKGFRRLQVVFDSAVTVRTGERFISERQASDTTKKFKIWQTRESVDYVGRQQVTIRVRFCPDACEPGLSTLTILTDAVALGYLESVAGNVTAPKN